MTQESSHPPQWWGRHRATAPRWTRATAAGAVTALALVAAGAGGVAQAAAPEITHELAATWIAPPASADNGAKLQVGIQINTNAVGGTKTVVPNVSFETTFHNASLAALPQVCLTEGVDPASSLSEDGRTLVCNLGARETGSADRIVVDLMAEGANGATVTGEVTFGEQAVTLPPIPIVAEPGVDIIVDALDTMVMLPGTNTTSYSAYFAVALPVGTEKLAGTVSFDVKLSESAGDGFAAVAESQGCGSTAAEQANVTIPLVPKTSPGSPLPASCTVTKTAPGVFRVSMDAAEFQQTLGSTSRTAISGVDLRTDRRYVAAGSLRFTAAMDLSQPTIERLTVSNVVATTVSGQTAPEVDTTNNEAESTIVPTGAFLSLFTGHAPWANDYGVLPHAEFSVFNGNLYLVGKASGYAADAQAGSCNAIGEGLTYAGQIANSVGGESSTITDLPVEWAWYTGDVGDITTFDCASNPGQWTTTEPTDFSTVRAVRMMWKPSAAVPADGIIQNVLNAFHVTVNGDTPVGTHVWQQGSFFAYGAWHRAGDTITRVPGYSWEGTTGARDVAHVIGADPSISKTASSTSVRVGDTVTYTVTSGLQVNGTPAGTGTWTVTDTMPAGVTLVPGSGSHEPTSTTVNPDGTSTVVWTVTGPYNTDIAITYDGVVIADPGNYTNHVTQFADGLGWGAPGSQQGSTAQATVTLIDAGTTILSKTDRDTTTAVGGSNTWTLSLLNKDTRTQAVTDVIDVLPYSGDEWGSDFSGTLTIDKVTGDGQIYYTDADPATLARDPADPSNGGFGDITGSTAGWSTTKPATVTGIRVIAGPLAPAQTRDVVIDWTATGTKPGDTLWNVAYARATLTGLKMTSAAEPVEIVGPSVSLTKSVDERIHQAGDILDWHLTLTNSGTVDATGPTAATVVDELPAGLTFLGASDDGVWNEQDRTITWTNVTVSAGQSVTLTVTTTVDLDQVGQLLTNPASVTIPGCAESACVTPPGAECVDRPGWSCAEIEIPTPKVQVSKVADRTVFQPDDTVVYTISVVNNGLGQAVGDYAARVVDRLPEGVTFVEASDNGAYDQATREVVWAPVELAAAEKKNLTLTVTVDAGTTGSTIVNPATVTVPGCEVLEDVLCVDPPLNPCTDLPGWSCAPIDIPGLELGKTAVETSTSAGGLVHWTVTVTNPGPIVLSNVSIVDTFDPTMEFVSASAGGTASSATTITWTVPTIQVGETVDLEVVTRVLPSAVDSAGQIGTQHNRVTVVPSESCVDQACVPAPTIPTDNQCSDDPLWACAEVPGVVVKAVPTPTPSPTPVPSPRPTTPLAHTGAGEWLSWALGLTVVLLVVGGAAVYLARKKRTEPETTYNT